MAKNEASFHSLVVGRPVELKRGGGGVVIRPDRKSGFRNGNIKVYGYQMMMFKISWGSIKQT